MAVLLFRLAMMKDHHVSARQPEAIRRSARARPPGNRRRHGMCGAGAFRYAAPTVREVSCSIRVPANAGVAQSAIEHRIRRIGEKKFNSAGDSSLYERTSTYREHQGRHIRSIGNRASIHQVRFVDPSGTPARPIRNGAQPANRDGCASRACRAQP